LAKSRSSRIPLIAACSYLAILVLLLILAVVVHDEFGFSFIPLLYATFPLSRMLYRSSNILFSIGIGGAVNACLLYALLKAAGYATGLMRKR
jgi:hypothetical protein